MRIFSLSLASPARRRSRLVVRVGLFCSILLSATAAADCQETRSGVSSQ